MRDLETPAVWGVASKEGALRGESPGTPLIVCHQREGALWKVNLGWGEAP